MLNKSICSVYLYFENAILDELDLKIRIVVILQVKSIKMIVLITLVDWSLFMSDFKVSHI